ncbi:MAG: ABC transporter ATP-binding protein [Burkholderiales bacterium]|nr:ABC transporter ATP-binding protein [Burkholderiales bacterium]
MTTIHIDRLRKMYKEQVAVAETTMTLESGQFVVFLGPSGCGKTTTLNCVAGFEEPTSGRILFDERDVTTLAPHERNVAMVFQSALLYPHLTALRNVEMSLVHAGIDAAEQKRRVAEVVELLHIGAVMHKRPGALSGGERQRVALAKALVRQPDVFLMDEPFSALDAALRNSLRSELVLLQKRLAVTTVFVTHDQVEAMTMGDVVVVMNAGHVEQIGSPQDIYERPASRFVAGFIGSPPMNLVDGRLEARAGRTWFRSESLALALPDALVAGVGAKAGESVTLGVRPQHLDLVDAGPGPGEGQVAVNTFAVERLGKENIVVGRHGEQVWRVIAEPHVQPALDSALTLRVRPEAVHLFGARS